MEDNRKPKQFAATQVKAVLGAVGVIVFIVIITGVYESTQQKSVAMTAATTSQATPAKSTTTHSNQSYTDGMYTGSGSYNSPGGKESIQISVTLANNIVTATSAVSGSTSPTSGLYQSYFISGYKSMVVGKNINDIHLGKVSGSSLTALGFNAALKSIENQAKA